MIKLKQILRCDVCGKPIYAPDGRLEWETDSPYICVCHDDCSRAVNQGKLNIRDLQIFSPILSAEAFMYKLNELFEMRPEFRDRIPKIASNLFTR